MAGFGYASYQITFGLRNLCPQITIIKFSYKIALPHFVTDVEMQLPQQTRYSRSDLDLGANLRPDGSSGHYRS
jgi:hypothetical protein